jgi:hypothetical protein
LTANVAMARGSRGESELHGLAWQDPGLVVRVGFKALIGAQTNWDPSKYRVGIAQNGPRGFDSFAGCATTSKILGL